MKILLGVSSFFPEHTAGTETYVFNLAKELKVLGLDIVVSYPAAGKKIEKYVYKDIDVYPFYVPLKLNNKELNGVSNKVSGLQEFIAILKEIKPDIFHLHSLSRSFRAEHILEAKKLGIKTVFTPHLAGNFCIRADLLRFNNYNCDGKVEAERCLSCFINKKYKYSRFLLVLLGFSANLRFAAGWQP